MAKPATAAGVSTGQCLCGKIAFEIDIPARWAWHDHSAASRRAHGAAYATYVGSWRKRFRVTKGEAAITRFEDKATKTVRSFCSHCGTPLFYERARSPHMVNISRALFSLAAPGGSRSTTSRSRNCRNGPIPASRWCRSKAFPAWSGSARKRRSGGARIRSNSPAAMHDRCSRRAAMSALHCLNDASSPMMARSRRSTNRGQEET